MGTVMYRGFAGMRWIRRAMHRVAREALNANLICEAEMSRM